MSTAVYGIFERIAYFGISSNLFVYLTKKLHQGTVISSNNVNNWVGTVFMTPILGAYIADAHLGRYWTFVIASLIYLSVCLSFTSLYASYNFIDRTNQFFYQALLLVGISLILLGCS
jgi:dipeptide/tripeptide permease